MPSIRQLPVDAVVRPYWPVEPFVAAWDAAANAFDAEAQMGRVVRGVPGIRAFADWDRLPEGDARELLARTRRLGTNALPETVSRRLARLAIAGAFMCHEGGGMFSEKAVAMVERMARERRVPSMTVFEQMVRELGLCESAAKRSVWRSERAVVWHGGTDWVECIPTADVVGTLRRHLEAITGAMRLDRPALGMAAWCYRELGSIHPLPSGSGRLARLLASVILMSRGGPPLLVSVEQNRALYACLRSREGQRGTATVRVIAEIATRSAERVFGASGSKKCDSDSESV